MCLCISGMLIILYGESHHFVLSLPCYCYGRYNTIAFDNAHASRHVKHWADDKINISGGFIKKRCPLSCIYPYSRCHVAQIADQQEGFALYIFIYSICMVISSTMDLLHDLSLAYLLVTRYDTQHSNITLGRHMCETCSSSSSTEIVICEQDRI